MIYHITTRDAWEQALERGAYTAPSLAKEGFIHCSTREQVVKVGNAFYRSLPNCVLLVIDQNGLSRPPMWEAPVHPTQEKAPSTVSHEMFPHVYGEIPTAAVVKVIEFTLGEDGLYTLPVGCRDK